MHPLRAAWVKPNRPTVRPTQVEDGQHGSKKYCARRAAETAKGPDHPQDDAAKDLHETRRVRHIVSESTGLTFKARQQ